MSPEGAMSDLVDGYTDDRAKAVVRALIAAGWKAP